MTEQERADEQRFWDAAFCAALNGIWSCEAMCLVVDNHHKKTGEDHAEYMARQAAEMADAAVAARRKRLAQITEHPND